MPGSFTQKKIDIDFDIRQGGFSGSPETITLMDHRVSCQVLSTGLETGMMCSVRIEGMKLSAMNRLSVAQASVIDQSSNSITVRAGDAGATRPTIFTGGIVEAFVDYAGAPNVAFQVTALSTAIPAAMPIEPTSFAAGAKISDIMQAIAGKVGLEFTNHGVDAVMTGGVNYPGSAMQQIDACARSVGIEYHIGMDTLSIWPKDVAASDTAILVSADTGMVGYPNYSQGGVLVQTLFNPGINFRNTIKLQSEYSPAAWVNNYGQLREVAGAASMYPPSNGLWVVQKIEHDLQTETPGGPWFTMLEAQRPEFAGRVATFGR
ncbi:hypothetical protein AD948_04395 [Acetobacter senegalensis]|uniref:Burkholderia phage Bcep781 gp38 n=1 Tax=Acetobacter senegalensis TaxID=446692 RepID=A0A149U5N9_9PROT|nr:hypothetical protein [Acetobacter senegalensis]KXV60670.1 hypothetical protein AD948_04395 [Acetobacter senegalensis]